MASTAASVPGADSNAQGEVSLARLYVLRAAYLLLVIGLGAMIVPEIVSHGLTTRGVIPSLLGAVWALALLGLRYPLQMLPLLLFELVWKSVWLAMVGLPLWLAGPLDASTAETMRANLMGLAIFPIAIPWGYVLRHYVRKKGDPWRAAPDAAAPSRA